MTKKKKIILSNDNPAGGKKPIVPLDKIKPSPKWAFSFEFFGQRRYFGLDKTDAKTDVYKSV